MSKFSKPALAALKDMVSAVRAENAAGRRNTMRHRDLCLAMGPDTVTSLIDEVEELRRWYHSEVCSGKCECDV